MSFLPHFRAPKVIKFTVNDTAPFHLNQFWQGLFHHSDLTSFFYE